MSQRQDPSQQTKLILIEPEQRASQQFSNLRQELNRNSIPYEFVMGFDKAKETMAMRDQQTIMVINNSYFDQKNIPKEIFGLKNTTVYCYPKESKNKDFSALRNSQHVINAYRKGNGQVAVVQTSNRLPSNQRINNKSPSNKIRLKSIKKDIKRNKDGKAKNIYERIMIIHPKNSQNYEYASLFDALKQNIKYVDVLKGQNQVKRYKGDKALLILEKEVFDDASRFLISERLDDKIDIAVLGFKKGLLKDNHVIATEKATDITDYILQSGMQIPGLRDKLDKNIMTSKNIIKSNKQLNANFEDIMSPDRPPRELQDSREGGVTSKLIRQQMTNQVGSPIGQNMLLNSKVSQTGSVDKQKVKKAKKVGSKKNGSIIDQSNSIMIGGGDSHRQNEKQGSQNPHITVIQPSKPEDPSQKHWKIYPDKNKSNSKGNGPLFVMEPQKSEREIQAEREKAEREKAERERQKLRQMQRQRQKERERERQRAREIQKQKQLQRIERQRKMSEQRQQQLSGNNNYMNGRNSENQVIYEMSQEYRGSNPSQYMNINNDSMASKNSLGGNANSSVFNKQPASPQTRNYTVAPNYSAKNYENSPDSEQMRRNSEIGVYSGKQSPILDNYRNGTNRSIQQNIQTNRNVRQSSYKVSPAQTVLQSNISKTKKISTDPATYVPTQAKITRTVTSPHRQPAQYNSSRAGIIYHQSSTNQSSTKNQNDRGINLSPNTASHYGSGNKITYQVGKSYNNSYRQNSSPTYPREQPTYASTYKYDNSREKQNGNTYTVANTYKISDGSSLAPRKFNPDDYDRVQDENGRIIYRAKSPTPINTSSYNITSTYQKSSNSPSPRPTSPTYGTQAQLRRSNASQQVIKTSHDVGSSSYNSKLKYHESSSRIIDQNNYSTNGQAANNVNSSRIATQNQTNNIIPTTNNFISTQRYEDPNNKYTYSEARKEYTVSQGGIRREGKEVQEFRRVESKEKRPSIQMRVQEVQKGKSIGYKPSNFVNANSYDASSSGSVYSNKVVGYGNNASENEKRMSKISRDSYSNQSSALTHHYFASANTVPLYGQTRPYQAVVTTRIDSPDMYNNLQKQYENLSVDTNVVHFIIDQNLPNVNTITYSIPHSSYKDPIDKVPFSQIGDKMSKQELPSSLYDIGFILTATPLNIPLTSGYHIVDISERHPQIDIVGDKNSPGKKNRTCHINIARPQNLTLVKKLLLAPFIEHYIFYDKSDSEVAKMLKLFPNNKFQKFGYTNRKDLQNMLSLHLKNKGRLVRILIFVNEENIRQCAPVMNSSLNLGTFNMICNLKKKNGEQNILAYQYPKVTFSDQFNFNSYGSVINFASHQNVQDNSHDEDQFVHHIDQNRNQSYKTMVSNANMNGSTRQNNLMITSNVSENQKMGEEAAEALRRGLHQDIVHYTDKVNEDRNGGRTGSINNIQKRIIYIQDQHKEEYLHEEIETRFPNMYQIKFFNSLENLQLPSNSGVQFVILHPEGDFLGGEVTDRHAMYVMLGDVPRLPSGVGKFHTKNQLFQYL